MTQEDLMNLLRYDKETGDFYWRVSSKRRKQGSLAGCLDDRGYRIISINWKNYKAHRLAYLYMTGDWPQYMIDHRDGNPSNNAWYNLREATNRQNQFNRYPYNRELPDDRS